MTMLVAADLHLTSNARDSYRWGLFEWLQEQVKNYQVSQVCLLGDITDSKDNHSSALVNRLITELTSLAQLADLFILRGNHDGVSDQQPFLMFIDEFRTNITFISKITSYWLSLPSKQRSVHCLFLPCTRKWKEDWDGLDFNQYDFIFTHQTFDGATAETGIQLPGIPVSVFKDFRGKLFSGDIHKPQSIGHYGQYCGSPYRVRFGDLFDGRVVIIDDDLNTRSLHYLCLSKHVVVIGNVADLLDQANKLKIKPNDQVKVRVSLSRQDLPTWKSLKEEIKKIASDLNWQLFGPELLPIKDSSKSTPEVAGVYKTSSQILAEFVKAKRLSDRQAAIGYSLIKEIT